MVETRHRNKNAHPAAPVMTEAAKVKAGIQPAKPRKKRTTKEARIRELEEEVARLKHPDDAHPSKEPLFIEDNSGDNAGTDSASDDGAPGSKRKRCAQDQRNLKRKKSYQSLADVRPTVRNKPSGLVNNWYDVATTSPPQQPPPPLHDYMHDPSHPASQSYMDNRAQSSPRLPVLQSQPAPTLTLSPLSQSQAVSTRTAEPLSQQFHAPTDTLTTPAPPRFHTPVDLLTTPAPPRFHTPVDLLTTVSPSTPHHFTSPTTDDPFWVPPAVPTLRQEITQDDLYWDPPIVPTLRQEIMQARAPHHTLVQPANNHHRPTFLPRPYVGENGEKWAVGIQDLPGAIRLKFRGNYIRRVIKSVFLGTTPWINPSIESLQQEFNAAYPGSYIKLHIDDAAVVPTIRDLGVLRSQIGKEAIRAVNDHLPGQYSKRQFDSKSARAAYIQALVSDTKQHPFIWESFRPGNLPVGGAKLYYDDKHRGRFQSVPVLRAFSVYWTAYGILTPIPPLDPGRGNRPIGALAMAAAAVERGYKMCQTGDYIELPNEFSATNWNKSTRTFCDIIENDLTEGDWGEIFKALHRLSDSRGKAARVKVGAPAEEPVREALLPADPPSSPGLD